MMKYAAIHSEYFESPSIAFFMGMTNMLVIYFVEVINLWNLSNITQGGTLKLIFDFIALGVISEFDDYFVEIYRYTRLGPLLGHLDVNFEKFI